MKRISTWLYIGAGVSLLVVYGIWFLYKESNPSYAERCGIFVGLWIPSLLIAGKIMEDRNK